MANLEAIKETAKLQALTDLLDEGVDVNFINKIIEKLQINIANNSQLSDLIDELRLFVIGDAERLGTLKRYIKQVSTDSLSQFSANYQQVLTQNLGLEFYKYSGNTIEDTRPFCRQRVNKIFHKKEIEKWAGLTWQGKIKGTNSSNIFIYRGGWNCRHQLIGINTIFVPKTVIRRNIANGNYKLKAA